MTPRNTLLFFLLHNFSSFHLSQCFTNNYSNANIFKEQLYQNNSNRKSSCTKHHAFLPLIDEVSHIYKEALTLYPFQTNCVTGGALALLGDAVAQSREENVPYDGKRAGAFVAFDISYRAAQTALFPIITEYCDGHLLGNVLSFVDERSLAVLEQTLANQLIVIPVFYYPLFFSLTGAVQGLTMEENIVRAKESIVSLLKRNWSFWIPVQYFQFGFVDEPLQIPFLCLAGLVWTCILSASAGSVRSFEEEEEAELIIGAQELQTQMDFSRNSGITKSDPKINVSSEKLKAGTKK
mmetsp:Transcript_14027/g.18377  ORF Transcript_14027/g.18377 Transcript_14027/m.18377 type:complete len:294 (-) Transcript_14027:666-1547(-)